jgi:hypothetical protein
MCTSSRSGAARVRRLYAPPTCRDRADRYAHGACRRSRFPGASPERPAAATSGEAETRAAAASRSARTRRAGRPGPARRSGAEELQKEGPELSSAERAERATSATASSATASWVTASSVKGCSPRRARAPPGASSSRVSAVRAATPRPLPSGSRSATTRRASVWRELAELPVRAWRASGRVCEAPTVASADAGPRAAAAAGSETVAQPAAATPTVPAACWRARNRA